MFSSKKMHLKILSTKRRPFCLDLNVLIVTKINLNAKGKTIPMTPPCGQTFEECISKQMTRAGKGTTR